MIVTGGAGYIGSHACKALKKAGYTLVTTDNLSSGWVDAAKFGPLGKVDLLDQAKLNQVFEVYQPQAIVHFAAFSQLWAKLACTICPGCKLRHATSHLKLDDLPQK